ncbi:MAG: helix-turn-helix domain-containing protein [Myxococcota bacterium]
MGARKQRERLNTRLVDDALGVFARLGYRVPVRRLASELGVTTGALYHQFGSKDEMFLEVLRSSVDVDVEVFPDLPPSIGPEDRVHLLLATVRLRETALIHRFLVLHEYLRHQEAPLSDEIVAGMDQYAAALGRFFGADDPAVGVFLLSVLNGALWRRYLDGGRTRWEDIERLLTGSISAVLAVPR